MSRSLHTQPYALRAERRLDDPYRRRAADPLVTGRPVGPSGRLRIEIRETPARPGFEHPAGATAVARFLARMDPATVYGLRRVELRHRIGSPLIGRLAGEHRPPGLIILYELPAGTRTRAFMLHVLAHELGHHLLSRRSGRPRVRTRRAADHERFADAFADGLLADIAAVDVEARTGAR